MLLLDAIFFEKWGPIKGLFRKKIFTINEIGIFHIIAE